MGKNKVYKRISEFLVIWNMGGTGYYFLEILFRGYSHWSMFVLGGSAFCFCTFQGYYMKWREKIPVQVLRGTIFVTALEFTTGIIFNKVLKMKIWDYSRMPMQLFGQICLPFVLIFSLLILAGILTGGMLLHWIFGEEKPVFLF